MKRRLYKKHYLTQIGLGLVLLSFVSEGEAWGGLITPPTAEDLNNEVKVKWTWEGPKETEMAAFPWSDLYTASYTDNSYTWTMSSSVLSDQKEKPSDNPKRPIFVDSPTLHVYSDALEADFSVKGEWPEAPWSGGTIAIAWRLSIKDASKCEVVGKKFHCPD